MEWINVKEAIAGLKAQTLDRLAGLIPDIYPDATYFATVPNKARIMPPAGGVGEQTTDPRASAGYGTASYFLRAPEDTFTPKQYIGGSNITVAPGGNVMGISYSNLIVAAALGFAVYLYFRRK